MSVEASLKREVQKAAEPYLKQIRELENKAQHRQQTVDSLKREANEKLQEAERLEGVAQQSMESGEDPKASLQEASRLRNEAQDLQGFIDKQKSDGEQERIQELKDDLAREVKKTIQKSKAMRHQSEALLQALREVVRIHEDWQEAVKSAFLALGLENKDRFKLLDFEDNSEEARLAKRIQGITHKFQHLFN